MKIIILFLIVNLLLTGCYATGQYCFDKCVKVQHEKVCSDEASGWDKFVCYMQDDDGREICTTECSE